MAYLASRNAKELAEILDRRISVLRITRVQWMTLYYIHVNSNITQKMLASLLGTKEPTVVRLIDRMEKDGLVQRVRKDRRSNEVLLTEKGIDLFYKGTEIAEKFKNDAISGIPEEYLEQFKWVLKKMVENTAD